MIYNEEFETMPREVIKALQAKRLQQALERVYHTVGFYKKSFVKNVRYIVAKLKLDLSLVDIFLLNLIIIYILKNYLYIQISQKSNNKYYIFIK